MPMRIRLIGAATAVLLLGACATVPPSSDDAKVVELIDLFNTVAAEELVGYVGVPFLFDDEVLATESDVVAVLARVQEAGLVVAPVITGDSDDPSAPADARFDVGVFYERLPDDARLILAESNAGDVALIVGDEADGLPQLLALFRGRP
jgi:hypothetical protein